MILLLKLSLLSLLITLIVIAVRIFIVPGIDKICLFLNYSSKTRGQFLGYATSIPELAIVISSAAAGVFDVGFSNIATSNIINWILFLSAVFSFRQCRDLKRKTFIDEISFGLFSVIIPLVMYKYEVQSSVLIGTGLLLLFIIYKILDSRLNNRAGTLENGVNIKTMNLVSLILYIITGVVLIVVASIYLGKIAKELVVESGILPWIIGWILGFVSSIPEMSGFFEVYRKHKKAGTLRGIDDTQEGLDTLVASNMSNLGIILPVGVFIAALI